MVMEQIVNSMLAPFMQQVGWQGFAYGLLGLKTLRRVFTFAVEWQKDDSDAEDEEQQE